MKKNTEQIEKITYECDFCKKTFTDATECRKHEKKHSCGHKSTRYRYESYVDTDCGDGAYHFEGSFIHDCLDCGADLQVVRASRMTPQQIQKILEIIK
jgi:hypothetical protein